MKSSLSKVALLPKPTPPWRTWIELFVDGSYLKRKANIFQADYAIKDLKFILKNRSSIVLYLIKLFPVGVQVNNSDIAVYVCWN